MPSGCLRGGSITTLRSGAEWFGNPLVLACISIVGRRTMAERLTLIALEVVKGCESGEWSTLGRSTSNQYNAAYEGGDDDEASQGSSAVAPGAPHCSIGLVGHRVRSARCPNAIGLLGRLDGRSESSPPLDSSASRPVVWRRRHCRSFGRTLPR